MQDMHGDTPPYRNVGKSAQICDGRVPASGRVALGLLLQHLLVAGCALEGGEAGGMEPALAPEAGDGAAPARGRDRGRGADDRAEEERAQSGGSVLAFHGTIVGVRIAALGDVML